MHTHCMLTLGVDCCQTYKKMFLKVTNIQQLIFIVCFLNSCQ